MGLNWAIGFQSIRCENNILRHLLSQFSNVARYSSEFIRVNGSIADKPTKAGFTAYFSKGRKACVIGLPLY